MTDEIAEQTTEDNMSFIVDIPEDEISSLRTRISNKWKTDEMQIALKDTIENTNATQIPILIDNFYKMFYNGDNEIKYKSYYVKKHIEKCLKILEIDAQVSTTTTKKYGKLCLIKLQ